MKKSYLYSTLFLKCPQCRQGNLLTANPYKLSETNRVREKCPKCGLKFHIEPAFYTGSMYVSYAVGTAVAIAVFIITYFTGLAENPLAIFGYIVLGLFLLMPYIGAVSKSIWAHFFFKYNPEIAKKVNNDSRT
ncbi:DUF983 domain-containing protein [Aequorivita echinoideorum]|uniref:DUF983 domain-containing protein n=1 Tax=Aequorivita echinoideorum TaxID=1549647 RepID=A0ABS5S0J8_9FLAO|nr:DUF983 domain-containing protein [Aequorivita echinoideorum]MBT0606743.1 DUF983 domain-containing protein [Aequorivita echinoideorum]